MSLPHTQLPWGRETWLLLPLEMHKCVFSISCLSGLQERGAVVKGDGRVARMLISVGKLWR